MGIPVKPLLAEAGLPTTSDFEDPHGAVPLEAVLRLFERAAEVTGRADFSLHYVKAFRSPASGLYGDLLRSSATIGEMFRLGVEFISIFASSMQASYENAAGVERFEWSYPQSISAAHVHFNLFIAAAMVARARSSTTSDWQPLKLELDHIAPQGEGGAAVAGFSGPRLRFEAGINRISVDASTLARPMVTANASRLALQRDLAQRWVEELRTEADTVAQTQRAIRQTLSEGRADLDGVSAAVGVSPRSLQWRLGRSGQTFERLLGEERRRLAENLLVNTDRPLTTISLPFGSAVVFTPCRSLPVPGSVMAMAPMSSPFAMRGSQRFFCSSVP